MKGCLNFKGGGRNKTNKSVIEMMFGHRENLTWLRYFGCRVWARPPGDQGPKLKSPARKGVFLGYLSDTTKNIYYWDVNSNRVKIASHFKFDETFNDETCFDDNVFRRNNFRNKPGRTFR